MAVELKEIINRYLSYIKEGESSFLFGKGAFSEQKWIWVLKPGKKDDYTSGEVIKQGGGKITCRTSDNVEITVNDDENTAWMNPPKFDGVKDCGELSHLSEAAVLHNLRKRYEADIIYTYSGLFLVVINPYRFFPIYNPVVVEYYRGKRRAEVPPHVFATSDTAYRAMLDERHNQSILITGESGAGKTENTKKVIQYLAHIAGKVGGGKLEEQILQCNPVLESFGNAKTVRNDNSSRFGKFIEIQFNAAGFITGASIVQYLLEKSRVVWQSEKERTFHIFYQIIAGANDQQRKDWRLKKIDDYKFIMGSRTAKGIDDKEEFNTTIKGFEICNFKENDIDGIMRIISGILLLGNLNFITVMGEGSAIDNKNVIEDICAVLGINAEKLEKGLCTPRIKAGNELIPTQLNVEKASYSREALCKALYHKCLFSL